VGKLDVGSIGVEEGREGVLHGEQGAAVAGSGAPAEIRWCLGVGELEQGWRKLTRGSVGAMGDRWRLPTVASSSPEGRSGAAVVIGLRVRTAKEKEVEMDQVLSSGTARQKRKGREVDAGAEHGGDDVAASGGSGGRGARETGQQGRKQDQDRGRVTRGGRPCRRWSGSGGTATAGGDALHRRQRGQSRGAEDARGRRKEGGSEGSAWNFQKSQGPYCKVRFPANPKP
jgi:hypothetical protein